MMIRRFKLTQRCKDFDNDGLFGFRIRFGTLLDDGRIRLRALRACPVIRMPKHGVIQVENQLAAHFIELMTTPNKTKRNRKTREAGPMFEEVTDSTTDYNVDFDSLLAAST